MVENWVEKIVEEQTQLGERILKLRTFLESVESSNVPVLHADLLRQQLATMQQYAKLLKMRVDRFGGKR